MLKLRAATAHALSALLWIPATSTAITTEQQIDQVEVRLEARLRSLDEQVAANRVILSEILMLERRRSQGSEIVVKDEQERAKQAGAAATDAAKALETSMNELPPATDQPPGATSSAVTTLNKCIAAAKAFADAPGGQVKGCSEKDLQDAANTFRTRAREAFEACRKTHQNISAMNELRTANVLNADDRAKIAGLLSSLGDAKDCVDKARQAGEDFDKTMHQAAALFGSVAMVCMTVPEPTTCAAFAVLQILANLFESGGGGGDGNGEGDGRGAKEGDGAQKSPGEGLGSIGGNGGTLVCNPVGSVYRCTSPNGTFEFPTALRNASGWSTLNRTSGTSGGFRTDQASRSIPSVTGLFVGDDITIAKCAGKVKWDGGDAEGIRLRKGDQRHLMLWKGSQKAYMTSDSDNCK